MFFCVVAVYLLHALITEQRCIIWSLASCRHIMSLFIFIVVYEHINVFLEETTRVKAEYMYNISDKRPRRDSEHWDVML